MYFKRFKLHDWHQFEGSIEVARSEGLEDESAENISAYILNEGTVTLQVIHRLLKDYKLFLHPELPRDARGLLAAWADQTGLSMQQIIDDLKLSLPMTYSGNLGLLHRLVEHYQRPVYLFSFNYCTRMQCFRLIPQSMVEADRIFGNAEDNDGNMFDLERGMIMMAHFRIGHYRSLRHGVYLSWLFKNTDPLPHAHHWSACLRRLGRYQDASAMCRYALEHSDRSNFSMVWSVYGGVLGDCHRYDDSITKHERAIELGMDHAQSYNGLGCSYHFKGEFESALRFYKLQVEKNPKSLHAWRNIGLAQEMLKNKEASLVAFRQQMTVSPDFMASHRSYVLLMIDEKRSEEVLEYYRQLHLECTPSGDELPSIVYAWILGELSRQEESMRLFDEILARNPGNDVAIVFKATLLIQSDPSEAIALLKDKLLPLCPQHPEAFELLGRAHYAKKEFTEAISLYRQQIEFNERERSRLLNLTCDSLLELQRFEEVLETTTESLMLNPRSIAALGARGVALTSMRRYEEALEVYLEQEKYDSEHITFVNYNLGICHLQLGRPREALTCFEAQLALEPNDSQTIMQLGHINVFIGETQRGLERYYQAVKLAPENDTVRVFIGETLYSLGQPQEAIEWYTEQEQRFAEENTRLHLVWLYAMRALGTYSNDELVFRANRSFGVPVAKCARSDLVDPATLQRLEEIRRRRFVFGGAIYGRPAWSFYNHRAADASFRAQILQLLLVIQRITRTGFLPAEVLMLICRHACDDDTWSECLRMRRHAYASTGADEDAYNLGVALVNCRLYREALPLLLHITDGSACPGLENLLGVCCFHLESPVSDSAQAYFRAQLARDAGHRLALVNLGLCLCDARQVRELAPALLRSTVRFAHGALGHHLEALSMRHEALRHQQKAREEGDPLAALLATEALAQQMFCSDEEEMDAKASRACRAHCLQVLPAPEEFCAYGGHLLAAKLLSLELGDDNDHHLRAAAHFVEQLHVDPMEVHKWWGISCYRQRQWSVALRHFHTQTLITPGMDDEDEIFVMARIAQEHLERD